MHLGIFIAITESTIRIDELAREVEARGFESLWVPEFTHVPVHRRTPLPPYLRAPGAGDEPPPHRSHLFDPFITLTGAAAVTQALRLGTGICLIIQHDTIMTAKAVACLDQLSGGARPLRHRRRVECRTNGAPRHRVQDPFSEDGRAGACHEGNLDAGRRRVPRRVCQLRATLVLAEAGPAAPPAGAPRG